MGYFSGPPEEARGNIDRIRAIFADVNANGVTEVELAQAKSKIASRIVLRSERPMGRLMSLGFHWAYRREYLAVERELEAFAAVTRADLRRVLDRWPLLPMTIVSVGPTTEIHPPD